MTSYILIIFSKRTTKVTKQASGTADLIQICLILIYRGGYSKAELALTRAGD